LNQPPGLLISFPRLVDPVTDRVAIAAKRVCNGFERFAFSLEGALFDFFELIYESLWREIYRWMRF